MQPTCLGEPSWQRQSSGASHPPLSGWLGALSWGWGLGTGALEAAFAFHPPPWHNWGHRCRQKECQAPTRDHGKPELPLSVQVHLGSLCRESSW